MLVLKNIEQMAKNCTESEEDAAKKRCGKDYSQI